MGIGAGWYEHEWRAYGYGFPPARERLRMLDEGVQIMRQAWTEGRASLDGKHYQVDGAIVRPLPLQEGGIPLWIAGGGEKVTLKIAAKYAQYTNFDGTLEGFAPQVGAARGALRRRRHRLRRDRPLGQLQRRHRRRPRPTSQKRLDALKARLEPYVGAERAETVDRELHAERLPAPRHARADRGEARRRCATLGLGYAHLQLPRGRLRPVGHRAVRARGDPALR